LKVLQINKFFRFRGGADKYFFELSQLLQNNGHEVQYFSTKNKKNKLSEFEEYFVDGFSEDEKNEIPLIVKAKSFFRGIYSLDAQKKIQQLVAKHSPDIAHAHNIFYQISPSIFPTLKERGIPTVMSLLDTQVICASAALFVENKECYRCKHSFVNILKYRCYQHNFPASVMGFLAKEFHQSINIWKNVDIFFTASSNLRRLFIEWGFDGSKIKVNPYFNNFVNSVPCYESDGYALFVGRLSAEKGIDTLLHAFKKSTMPLVIIGDGPQRDWAIQFIRENSLQHIKIVGFVSSQEELNKYISRSSFVVIPSNWFEVFPLIALDALSLGKPVIGANTGGIPEIVDDGKNGFIFERLNADDLADKVKNLQNNDYLCKELGKNGRKKAESEYTVERHYSRMMEEYSSLLGYPIKSNSK
jgi:glycosyltransferase involved in cell wall biosynthesis